MCRGSGLRRVPAGMWAGVPAAGRGHSGWAVWGGKKAWYPPAARDLFAQCWGREADAGGGGGKREEGRKGGRRKREGGDINQKIDISSDHPPFLSVCTVGREHSTSTAAARRLAWGGDHSAGSTACPGQRTEARASVLGCLGRGILETGAGSALVSRIWVLGEKHQLSPRWEPRPGLDRTPGLGKGCSRGRANPWGGQMGA